MRRPLLVSSTDLRPFLAWTFIHPPPLPPFCVPSLFCSSVRLYVCVHADKHDKLHELIRELAGAVVSPVAEETVGLCRLDVCRAMMLGRV